VDAAYLNADIKEDIYLLPPPEIDELKGNILKLKKSLYRLRQSAKNWNDLINKVIIQQLGFKKTIDDNIYVKDNIAIGLYVDDLFLSCDDLQAKSLLLKLNETFAVKSNGRISHALGIEFEEISGGYALHQLPYIQKLLEKYSTAISTILPRYSPLPTSYKGESHDDEKTVDKTKYQSLLGSLLYVANATRFDIIFAVNCMARYAQAPRESHWNMLLHILGYLKSTVSNKPVVTVTANAVKEIKRMMELNNLSNATLRMARAPFPPTM
jgi:hypothetical protein